MQFVEAYRGPTEAIFVFVLFPLCIGALLNWCSYNWSLVIGILVYFRKQLVELDTSVHNGHLQLFLGRKFNFHQQITATQTQNTNTEHNEHKHRTQTQNTNTCWLHNRHLLLFLGRKFNNTFTIYTPM